MVCRVWPAVSTRRADSLPILRDSEAKRRGPHYNVFAAATMVSQEKCCSQIAWRRLSNISSAVSASYSSDSFLVLLVLAFNTQDLQAAEVYIYRCVQTNLRRLRKIVPRERSEKLSALVCFLIASNHNFLLEREIERPSNAAILA